VRLERRGRGERRRGRRADAGDGADDHALARGRDGESFETTLTCDPAEGTHPSPEAACSALAADREALEPVPPDVACTLIFGGPERATVVGVLDGADVDAAFERSNGCEIDRWDRVAPLLQIRPALR
jgi:hypothetical protein